MAAQQQVRGAAPTAQGVKPEAQPEKPMPVSKSNFTVEEDKNSPGFGAGARNAMNAEIEGSPVATKLLNAVKQLPNKVIIKYKPDGEAETSVDGVSGDITISINLAELGSAGLSHELAHAIQRGVQHNELQRIKKEKLKHAPPGTDPSKIQFSGEEINAAANAGRSALHTVVPVRSKHDEGQEYLENEAMRVAHIVNAERIATEIKNLPDDKKPRTKKEIMAEFNRRMDPKITRKHDHNNLEMHPESLYGDYDFHYLHQATGYDQAE